MLHLGQKLEQARLSAGLNLTEAAKKLGKKRSTYQYWEKEGPPINEIPVIVTTFNLPENYFFGNDPLMFSKELPLGDLRVTLKDHFDLLNKQILKAEEDKAYFKEILKSSLVDISANLSEILKKKVADRSTPGQGETFVPDHDEALKVSNKRDKRRSQPDKQDKKTG